MEVRTLNVRFTLGRPVGHGFALLHHACALATPTPGCPCNATKNAATFRCSAGYRCSTSAYHGLSTEVVMQTALGRLQAVCVACDSGQYCPQGTFLQVSGEKGLGADISGYKLCFNSQSHKGLRSSR